MSDADETIAYDSTVRNCRTCHQLYRYRAGGSDQCSNCRPDGTEASEGLISKINQGHTGAVLMQWLEPILSEVAGEALSKMKRAYRDGKPSADYLAQLAVLDEIRSRIDTRIREGREAQKEITRSEDMDDGN